MISEWISAEQKPLDDNDCLVIFKVDGQRLIRAPVFWHDEKEIWIDEWNNEVIGVEKYILIPEL